MGLDNLLKRVIPAAVGYATGGPVGAFTAATSADQQARAAKRQKVNLRNYEAEMKARNNMDPLLQSYPSGTSLPTVRQAPTTQNAGFGSSFGSFLTDVGRNIINPIGSLFSSPVLQPFISPQSSGQPAQPTQGNVQGQETSRSGTQEAFVGGVGNVLGQAARLLRSPAGNIGIGTAVGVGSSLLAPQTSSMRITRKMKSQYRAVLNLAGGNYQMAADMIGVSDDMFIAVMLKRFRNDGPVVTKAALRKTKTTVRRLKSMCDMYDSLRPSATRRRSPMKRASTTLISNK